jgi:hypothetical protein
MPITKKPKESLEVTVVLGQRGGGQLLGVFTDESKIQALMEMTEEYQEKGYVVFEKVQLNEFQTKKFGLYFK